MQNYKEKIYKLLRWSEKYTGTDMVYLAQGGLWLVAAQVFVIFSSFVLNIAYANLLPKDVFGTYKYILSISGVFGALTLSGLSTSIIRKVARDGSNILRGAFWTQLRWSIFILIAGLLAAIYYSTNGNSILATSFLIAGALSPISQSAGLYISFLIGKKEFRLKTKYDVLGNLIPVLTILATVFVSDNIIVLISAYFISYTACALFFYSLVGLRFKETEKLDDRTISYGKHLSAMGILGTIAAQFDKVLMFHYLGAVNLAIYTLALAPVTQASSLLKSLNLLSLPKFSAQGKNDLKRSLPKKMTKLSLFLMLPVLGYFFAAPYLYKLFFPNYLESILFSQFYMITLIFYPQEIIRTALTAQESKKGLYVLATAGPLLKIILLGFLLPTFGIQGAIMALLIHTALNTLLARYLFSKI